MLPDAAVEHISNDHIEAEASRVRSNYPPDLPFSVERLVEHDLGYALEITNDGLFADKNVLGGISFEQNTVFVNTTVEAHEGRYNFTLAHEVGHHVLHRELYLAAFGNHNAIMCREAQARPLIEKQADRFAAALLLPAAQIWSSVRGEKAVTKAADAIKLAERIVVKGGFSGVSVSALINRMIDLGVIDRSIPYQSSQSVRKNAYRATRPFLVRAAHSSYRRLTRMLSIKNDPKKR